MGDVSSDTEAQLHMMRDAYEKLQSISPDHELLKLAQLQVDRGGFIFTTEYGERCVDKRDEHNIQGYMRYTQALENAAMGLEYKLLGKAPTKKTK